MQGNVLEDLFPALAEELGSFAGKQHYAHSTYNAGCRGLMCRAVVRHEYRFKRYVENAPDDVYLTEFCDKNVVSGSEEIALTEFILGHLRAQARRIPDHLLLQMRLCGIEAPQVALSGPDQMILAALERIEDSSRVIKAWRKLRSLGDGVNEDELVS